MKKILAICVCALALGVFVASIWSITYPFPEDHDFYHEWHVALKVETDNCRRTQARQKLIAVICSDY